MKQRVIFLTAVFTLLLFTAGCEKGITGTDVRESSSGEVTAQLPEEEEPPRGLREQAAWLAAGYDYDGAVTLLKGDPEYESSRELQDLAAGYKTQKAACVPADVDTVPHVFYHSLIVDTSRAFDGDQKEGAYNQVMTTVEEFEKITQQMYQRGYVLVRLKDMVNRTVDEKGNVHFTKGEILLPEGKKPYVLSVDDLSYYHYMDGDGFASRMVVDKAGRPKCEYIQDDGTVLTGNYDVVPLLDSFIRKHPDAAYKGAKGLIALTGYNGVLGYRTDTAYQTGENLDSDQEKFLQDNPDFDFDNEVAQATQVAEALKKDGWEFASHTWGHLRAYSCTYEHMVEDTKKWKQRVAPIVGDTDVIIFAFGEDIGDWREYSQENEKYQFLKGQGYRYFCNVDSSTAWVQIKDEYVRQGRRNLDGYRMYYDMTGDNDKLSDLFDAESVFDHARPIPVPPMGEE